MPRTSSSLHYSERQRAEVSDQGFGFGDIHLFDAAGHVEARFLWTRTSGVSLAGYMNVPRHYNERAVRALAETSVGRGVLGLPDDFDAASQPSADEAELADLERSVLAKRAAMAATE